MVDNEDVVEIGEESKERPATDDQRRVHVWKGNKVVDYHRNYKKNNGRNFLGESGQALFKFYGFSFRATEEMIEKFDKVHARLTKTAQLKGESWDRAKTMRVILKAGLEKLPADFWVDLSELQPESKIELDDNLKKTISALLLTHFNEKITDSKKFTDIMKVNMEKFGLDESLFADGLEKLRSLVSS